MSGITGEISFKSNLLLRQEELLNMMQSVIHRGKKSKMIFSDEQSVLMQNSSCSDKSLPYSVTHLGKKYIIVYDGMIFNYDELKNRLSEKGFCVCSSSDEELILKLYICFGEKSLEIINGVFAFCIWCPEDEKLFASRDRMGIKPLFYSVLNDNFIFSSEIKGLLCNSEIKPEIDLNSIYEILFIGPGRTPGYGVFKNINELKPGHCCCFSKEGFSEKCYWKLEAHEHKDNFEQTVEHVRELLIDSVKKQLKSEFPVCSMLSGGLDSSIVTSIIDREYQKSGLKLNTYTVSYKDNDKFFKETLFQPNSDTKFIGIMNDYLNAENHSVEINSSQLVSALYDAVIARDLPGMADVDSSLLEFCKAISQSNSIAFSGECSDEIFGGYPWYRNKEMRDYDGFPWAKSTEFRKQFLIDDLLGYGNPEEYVYSRYKNTVNNISLVNTKDPDKRIKEIMQLNLDWFMMTLVDRCDRMSAYSSLDVRVPYCDYRIVEYLYSVPWEYKEYKGYEKGLLREAFKDYLPKEIATRKKSPYPKTHNPDYLFLVREELKKLLNDTNAPIFSFIKKSKLEELLTTEIPQNFYGQLMTTPQTIAYFLQINYWLENYKIKIDI